MDWSTVSYGPQFDILGGGMYAMKWDETGIAVCESNLLVWHWCMCLGVVNMKNRYLTIATKRKCIMLPPGRKFWCMIIPATLAQSATLIIVRRRYFSKILNPKSKQLTFFPVAVRPRASLCLWTGLQIQLIRGSRRILKKGSGCTTSYIESHTALWLGSTSMTS